MKKIDLNNVAVGIKLGAGFGIIVLLAAILIFLGISVMDDYHRRSVIVGDVSSAESFLLDARVAEKNYQVRNQADYIQEAKALADQAVEILLPLKELFVIDADDTRVDAIVAGVAEYKTLLGELQDSTERGDMAIGGVVESLVDVARGNVDTAVELQEVQLQRMEEQYRSMVKTFLIVGAAILIIAAGMAWWLVRSVTRPIRETVQIANRVASSDLTVQVDSERGDEFGQLLAALSAMVTNLRELIRQIDGGASNIASSSEELATVTQTASEGAQTQSDGVDQVATAMNEMVATVTEVAKSAEAAFEAASRADEKATQGESAVEETVSYMVRLDTQNNEVMDQLRSLQQETTNIGSILEVIKTVADQTNLLALNAAIEAARAGEHGRGFSVVAEEVRSLAQRTQDSTSEIETLIANLVASASSSVQKMESGTQLSEETLQSARKTGETIREMAAAVEEIRQHNNQIATAAEQQTSVAEEINQNIISIRDIAEQSASSTEQVSASSDDLARLAENLSSQVSRFKL